MRSPSSHPSQPSWDRLHAEFTHLASAWDNQRRISRSFTGRHLVDLVEASPRQIARQAVLDLGYFLQGYSVSSYQRSISQQLKHVRDRHSLTRRAHFYAFISEIDYQLKWETLSANRWYTSASYSWTNVVHKEYASKPTFITRLARFLGLSHGATDREYRSLTNRDLEDVWESLLADVDSASDALEYSLWQMLQDCLVEILGARMAARPVERRTLTFRDVPRERLVLYGFWSGTPPPADVAALRSLLHADQHPTSPGGNDATLHRSRRRRDLYHWCFKTAAKRCGAQSLPPPSPVASSKESSRYRGNGPNRAVA